MKHEVVLHRCECRHCDEAEQELRRLAAGSGASLDVVSVRSEGLGSLAGWSTPIVVVNGLEVSELGVHAALWKEALAVSLERKSVRGVLLEEGHALALSAESGESYRLVASRLSAGALEEFRGEVGRTVTLEGNVFVWKEKRALVVGAP